MKKYMVIETMRPGALQKVYERFHANGRVMPKGLHYIDSWLEKDGHRCFQLMQTADFSLFSEWTKHWRDLTDFEIVEIGEKPAS